MQLLVAGVQIPQIIHKIRGYIEPCFLLLDIVGSCLAYTITNQPGSEFLVQDRWQLDAEI